MKKIDLMSTIKGSLLDGFFPRGWNLAELDRICALPASRVAKREKWWNRGFTPTVCESLGDFDVMMGHEIAMEICNAKDAGRKIVFILPVGPMGMYRWAVFFLKAWNVDCRHVYGFNMDEWSDRHGQTLPARNPGAFQNAMEKAFYGPLGRLTVPKPQRYFATRDSLPQYPERIAALRKEGAKLVTVFGIGRVCHIAFWEPHFAAEFKTAAEWEKQCYRLGARLHPLTIEQNALTSFNSRSTLVPAFANTVGPGLFLQSDYFIGGCDGVLGRGMMWQAMSFRLSLHHAPTPWIPSTFMPTLPGKLFYLRELAGSLMAECN